MLKYIPVRGLSLILWVSIAVSSCTNVEQETVPLPTVAVLESTPSEQLPPPTDTPQSVEEEVTQPPSVPTATPTAMPTSPPTVAPTPTISPPLTWKQLKNTTYRIPEESGGPEDGLIPMEDGFFSYTVVPGSASESKFILYPGVAFGDINGDGSEDAVVVIINVSAGSGNFYHLLPVLNEGGQPLSLASTFIGDRVVVEQLTITESGADLLTRTYRPEEPFGSTPTLLVKSQFQLVQEVLEKQSEEVLNADEVVNEADLDEVVPIEIPPGGGSTIVSGTTGPFGLDRYELFVIAGQTVTTSISSPYQDSFLSIFGTQSGALLVPARDEQVFWSGVITQTENLSINVFSIGSETEYLLEIQTAAPPEDEVVEIAPAPPPPVSGEGANVVYLTFDDGPAPAYTSQILDLLARYNARATFFLLGVNSQSYGETLEAIRQGGHTLANHTWSHLSLAGMSQADFNQEISSTAQLLGPDPARCLRPPYGATDSFTRAYAAELGYEVIMWNIDTLDWSQPGTDAIVSSVLSSVYPGAIVLMHDGGGTRDQTVAALETVLNSLSSQGYIMEPMCR